MPQNFISPDRDQVMLLPPDLREWLPEGHLATFVIDAVDELDLSAFYAVYRADGHGRAAYDPAMMVALVLYAYAIGVRSSRAIERRCVEDIAMRVVAGNLAPDYRTISRFRARHEAALGALFGQVLGLCARAGLVSAGLLAVDGTKIRANAAMSANRSFEQLAREALAEAAAVDAAEDELLGDRRGDELPGAWADRRGRRERIRQALAELQREKDAEVAAHEEHLARRAAIEQAEGRRLRGRKPKPPGPEVDPNAKANVTDPQSRVVKTPMGYCQGYNAQIVATGEHIIVAADVLARSPDGGLLEPMITAAREQLDQVGVLAGSGVVLADAGYWHSEQVQQLAAAGYQPLVTPDAHDGPAPEGNRTKRHRGLIKFMREVLARPDGAALYRRRQAIVEPIFGDLKHNRRADQFARRGLTACRSEFSLLAATHNLLKLHRALIAA